jgi:hypothetical protein
VSLTKHSKYLAYFFDIKRRIAEDAGIILEGQNDKVVAYDDWVKNKSDAAVILLPQKAAKRDVIRTFEQEKGNLNVHAISDTIYREASMYHWK